MLSRMIIYFSFEDDAKMLIARFYEIASCKAFFIERFDFSHERVAALVVT